MQTSNSLSSYFRTEVDYAVRTEGLKTGELTETYLAQLLADYAAQPVNHEPLTLRLMEAMSEPPREQRQHLREIGDTSLFVSGFWGGRALNGSGSTSTTTSAWAEAPTDACRD